MTSEREREREREANKINKPNQVKTCLVHVRLRYKGYAVA
jgi:hypothetical protein